MLNFFTRQATIETMGLSSIYEHVPLAPLTSFQLGGSARFYAQVASEDELFELLGWAKNRHLDVRFLGGGSNLLVSDQGVDGLVIHVALRGRTVRTDDQRAHWTVAAGEPLDAFIEECVRLGHAGFECLSGIPGLVGATPIQNVGAYGQEIADCVVRVRSLDVHSLKVIEREKADCQFSYRDSLWKRSSLHECVLSVDFSLEQRRFSKVKYAELKRKLQTDSPSLQEARDGVIALRSAKSMVLRADDENKRSAGSFFTNPIVTQETYEHVCEIALKNGWVAHADEVPNFAASHSMCKLAAAWLIERAGFSKGFRFGHTHLSTRHALAIVNDGAATTAEVLHFSEMIQSRVQAIFSVTLLREPVLWE